VFVWESRRLFEDEKLDRNAEFSRLGSYEYCPAIAPWLMLFDDDEGNKSTLLVINKSNYCTQSGLFWHEIKVKSSGSKTGKTEDFNISIVYSVRALEIGARL